MRGAAEGYYYPPAHHQAHSEREDNRWADRGYGQGSSSGGRHYDQDWKYGDRRGDYDYEAERWRAYYEERRRYDYEQEYYRYPNEREQAYYPPAEARPSDGYYEYPVQDREYRDAYVRERADEFGRDSRDYYDSYSSAPQSSREFHTSTAYRDGIHSKKHGRSLRRESSSPAPPVPPQRPMVFKPVIGLDKLGLSHKLPSPTAELPPPQQMEPTEEYMAVSLQPSSPISDPTQLRKLIVLDLNGSLLLRSEHRKRAQLTLPQRGGYRNSYSQHPNNTSEQFPRLRSVYPRPFLAAFRDYILHPETKKWLDVMVWSSAQPHSVDDMVDKCFMSRKGELVAVWARDTLGLTSDQYRSKSRTYKDLAKPWSELPLLTSRSSHSRSPHTTPARHSAQTTLLIDDSPLKASLQPYNHLCISEYVSEDRKKDLAVAAWESAKAKAEAARLDLEAEMLLQQSFLLARDAKLVEILLPRQQASALASALADEAASKPEVTKVIREVVMIEGKMIGEEHVVKKVTKEVVMVDGEMVGGEEEEVVMPTSSGVYPSATSPAAGVSVQGGSSVISGQHTLPNQAAGIQGAMGPVSDDTKISRSHRNRKRKRLAKREAINRAKEELEREALEAASLALGFDGSALSAKPDVLDGGTSGRDVGEGGEAGGEAGKEVEERRLQELMRSDLAQLEGSENADKGKRNPVQTHSSHASNSALSNQPQPTHNGIGSNDFIAELESKMLYDETLLAVVGILDEAKVQSNVAGWVRSGGLLDISRAFDSLEEADETDREAGGADHETGGEGMVGESVKTGGTSSGIKGESPEDEGRREDLGKKATSNDVDEPKNPEDPLKWYTTPTIRAYWVARGRRALEELGIEVSSGIVVDNASG